MRSCDSNREALRLRLAGQQWRLIEEAAAPGAWNMAVDEALLEFARRDEAPPTLRLYGWARPTLSLGRHQDPCAGIDHDYRRRQGIDRVRRPTGGRAVLHDREVTYSIVLPACLARGAGVGDVYQVLSGALLEGLSQAFGGSGVQVFRCSGVQAFGRAGIQGFRCSDQTDRTDPSDPSDPAVHPSAQTPARLNATCTERLNARTPERPTPASCFATAAGGDGLAGDGKLVGSAQARRGGAVLQHGSVLLEVRRGEWEGLFGTAGLEVALADLAGAPPDERAVRAALRAGVEAGLEAAVTPGVLSRAERSEAERLMAERYGVGRLD